MKRIPYRTVWVELVDVESKLRPWGAKPGITEPEPSWTVPVLSFPHPSGKPTFISESFAIALELDKLYPSPCIFPPGTHALQTMFAHSIATGFHKKLLPLLIPRLADHCFRPANRPYWLKTRTAMFGDLDAWCPEGSEKRELAWAEAKKTLDLVDMAMRHNPNTVDGEFVMGSQLTMADIGIVVQLIWLEKAGAPGDWERVCEWHDGRWKRLFDRFVPYMQQTD